MGNVVLCSSISADLDRLNGRGRYIRRPHVCPFYLRSHLSQGLKRCHRDTYFSLGHFYVGNEPSFGVPWIYHYAGRPDLSAQRVREVIKEFGVGVNGYALFPGRMAYC